jgi:ketosteroid isomerase-like protein
VIYFSIIFKCVFEKKVHLFAHRGSEKIWKIKFPVKLSKYSKLIFNKTFKLKTKKMKTKLIYLMIFATIMIAGNSCNQKVQKLSKDEMKKIVEGRNNLLGEYFKTANIEKLAAMYCDSAKLCPDGLNFIHGRDSIKAFWSEDFKTSKTLGMTTKVFTVDGDENIIYETGKASSKILYQDSIYNVTVKYINVWCKQANGDYLLDIDFWNRNSRK